MNSKPSEDWGVPLSRSPWARHCFLKIIAVRNLRVGNNTVFLEQVIKMCFEINNIFLRRDVS